LGLGSSGLPIPRCMSASSITSMELRADVRVAAIVHGNADQCYAGRSYTVDLCSCNKTRYRSLTQDDCLESSTEDPFWFCHAILMQNFGTVV
jgi:tRNA pseudouridine-54 N-methylase